MELLNCFKAYDIRGRLGVDLNAEIAYRIGRAFAQFLNAQSVVVGGDVRLSSEELKFALIEGLRDEGADVTDLGMVGTEEVYFATSHLSVSGGIEVTASHNPIDFNGMKLVREGSRPISSDTGLLEIKKLAEINQFSAEKGKARGSLKKISLLKPYVDHLLGYIDLDTLRPMRILMNSGNGAAGPVLDEIQARFVAFDLPIEVIKINNTPDGTFPNGIPNPILQSNRQPTIDAVLNNRADIGIAWDGDFDRCFFVDETGRFIEGYYIVGLLTEAFLRKKEGQKIVHDPRLVWNTLDIAERCGGKAIQSKTGHAFIKERMRAEDAVYGGEMSAHHYFKDFFYCDSGMIPWLLVLELMSRRDRPLSELVDAMIAAYPSPGEINRALENPELSIKSVKEHYKDQCLTIDFTDGVGMEFADWRFNLRMSNTEPVVRLNIETRGDPDLLEARTHELLQLLDSP